MGIQDYHYTSRISDLDPWLAHYRLLMPPKNEFATTAGRGRGVPAVLFWAVGRAPCCRVTEYSDTALVSRLIENCPETGFGEIRARAGFGYAKTSLKRTSWAFAGGKGISQQLSLRLAFLHAIATYKSFQSHSAIRSMWLADYPANSGRTTKNTQPG